MYKTSLPRGCCSKTLPPLSRTPRTPHHRMGLVAALSRQGRYQGRRHREPWLHRWLYTGFRTRRRLRACRKPGKLPADTIRQEYAKEYGTDVIEIHRDAIGSDDIVVIHDDVLATGGTMAAAIKLVKSLNPKKIYVNFIIELTSLNGRAALPDDVEVTSLISY